MHAICPYTVRFEDFTAQNLTVIGIWETYDILKFLKSKMNLKSMK